MAFRRTMAWATAIGATFGHVAWRAWQGPPPAPKPIDPWAFAANQLGFWALVWLIAALACGPVATLAGRPGLLGARRAIGLWAFALAVIHSGVWAIGARRLDLGRIAGEIAGTPWLACGALALAIVASLAATTPAAVARRLGPALWRKVHRLAHLAAALACLHYALRDGATVAHWVAFVAALGAVWAARALALRRT